jgi:hypothetical protein
MSWPNCARRWAKFRPYPIIGDQLAQLRGGVFVSIGGGEDRLAGAADDRANVSQDSSRPACCRGRIAIAREFFGSTKLVSFCNSRSKGNP